ncbi:MAG: nucleotidyltransferase substrate binding protein [Candidatus Aminicenantes bacterium]|nr:MAG: nucleotidyltransferase substrate binding protein [Candidatus Aminicenantes bacterium]
MKEFKEALENFSYLVNLDLASLNLDKRLIDAIENGMIQKFEYSIEICWKLIKKFLKQEDGIDAKTPKQSVKEFYLAGYIDEDNYLKLVDMIDDRNKLSHMYDEEEFRKILKKFPKYLKVFEKVEEVISSKLPRQDEIEKEE